MQVGPLITMKPLVASSDQSLVEVARAMQERKVGSAIVMTDQGPAIITERDLLRAVAMGADLSACRVDEYMTSNAITVTADCELRQAAHWMLQGNFRHLIVISGPGEVAGVISMRDLVAALVGALDADPTPT
jgi:CBS domain-containing protein